MDNNTSITPEMVRRMAVAHFNKHSIHFLLVGEAAAMKEIKDFRDATVTERAALFVDTLEEQLINFYSQRDE